MAVAVPVVAAIGIVAFLYLQGNGDGATHAHTQTGSQIQNKEKESKAGTSSGPSGTEASKEVGRDGERSLTSKRPSLTSADKADKNQQQSGSKDAEGQTGSASGAAATSASSDAARKRNFDLATTSRDDVVALLLEVISVQKKLSQLLDVAMEQLAKEPTTSLMDAYKMVRQKEPNDPLEAHGLSLANFDALLDRFATDEEVHQLVMSVIQGPEPSNPTNPSSDSTSSSLMESELLSCENIIEINTFMREQLSKLVAEFQELRPQLGADYHSRTASLTAQAVVGSLIKKKFNVASDQVERAMMVHQLDLSNRPDFVKVNQDIQTAMAQLLETQ